MSLRLCAICHSVLTGPQCLRQERPHHQSTEDVLQAAAQGCYVCGVITRSGGWKSLADAGDPFHGIWYLSKPANLPVDWLKLTIDAMSDDDEEEDEDEGDEANDGGPTTSATSPDGSGFALPKPPAWGFLLQPVEAVRDNVSHHVPSPGGLESPGFLDLPLQWFTECDANHARCRPQKPDFYPSRVLEIVSQDVAKLVISGEDNPQGRYTSLSHCWGKAKTLKLLESNMDQLRIGIDIATLPTSYREAITVCRRFGFRYIWIDSLCIIQDSREDWARESITMKDVYENSALNIAAAAAAESSEASFLSRDPYFIRPVQVGAEWDDIPEQQYYLVDNDLHVNDLKDSPLHQRAWVLQEVFLAKRNLSLTANQLWFECPELDACETYPQGVPAALLSENINQTGVVGLPPDEATAAICRQWWGVMERYAACFLTFPGDKMIALAGIAQHFQGRLPNDTYLAAMWRSQLPLSLNWGTQKWRPCYRPDDGYRAPSWSWASIEGRVIFNHEPALVDDGTDVSTPCVVVDVAVHAVDAQQDTGFLRGGYIQIRAPLTEVGILNESLSLEISPGEWDYIEGSDEAAGNRFRGQSWTVVGFDECTPDGRNAVSYLSPLTEKACLGGQMDGLTRVREAVVADVEEGLLGYRFFALPVVRFLQAGKPFYQGIILFRRQDWPTDIYQRAGEFTAAGEVTVEALDQCSSLQLITIV
ncbi:heterokaryon incompatibility protein-domain-containing protein [Apodospora peruviana]|uniref:Heterokaryon incompatibility protein-domain-containing protein n=1 Tax=Apodospora peruviana TaxID=516989 RepID=A0AAE0MGY5_9PEZI|nr:heterokaryon incompatibility protein-domain-containing protein [Apodospora peruviana]